MTSNSAKLLRARDDGAGWWLGIVAAIGLMLTLSACNTMSGLGKDVEAAGGAMSDTAEDVEDDL